MYKSIDEIRKQQFKRRTLKAGIVAGTVGPCVTPVSVERWLEEMWRLHEGQRPSGMVGAFPMDMGVPKRT